MALIRHMDQGYTYSGWDEGARIRSGTADDDDDDDDEDDTHSDDGPLLHYNNEKCRRYPSHCERERRRPAPGLLVKMSLFCAAMIMFCVLMYIPMYSRVIDHMPKDIVAGWTVHTNRDTKIYVQPDNVTTLFEPTGVCSSHNKKNKLFLLIIVCSSTNNFERRIAIRETWGNYQKYLEISKIYTKIKEKYKNYNFTYDLYPEPTVLSVNATQELNRTKRDVGFGLLLPKIAEALKKNLEQVKTEEVTEEKRFDDDNNGITDFDMNKELEKQVDNNEIDNYDYEESNVMRIPPNGDEDNPDLDKVISMLKKSNFKVKVSEVKEENVESSKDGHLDVEFKVAFLLGLPNDPKSNNSNLQLKIEEEVAKYGDIIQENFIDSYNNLTLKSIMMLKWVTHHCNDSLRYILKSDDDMYINMPNLMATLKNRSKEYEKKVQNGLRKPEYLLMGDLISGAKPVLDASNKWFSPRYMYSGRVYPRYLSGTAYALSAAAAHALYRAALHTPYFHLEDVYITGMCALRSSPPIAPSGAAGFSPRAPRRAPCVAHAAVTSHRVTPEAMRRITEAMLRTQHVDRCERMRLTQMSSRESWVKALNKKVFSFWR
ncbi:beta-1,3-galactosyltransferase 2 isoform X2 [Plutella xylostella]|uniref:beta-1,3-galactosyltransferase 2 isoform X2 n=1 Tax=Plutella xylostella TaxID=51655 RepID=UPI0020331534|nr:beta-1,3-galactosyltransferase 2 isoform X2 [Plutella xylostella]